MGASVSLWCQSFFALHKRTHTSHVYEKVALMPEGLPMAYFDFGPVNGQVHDVSCECVHEGSAELADYPIYKFTVDGLDGYVVSRRVEFRLRSSRGSTICKFQLHSNDVWGMLVHQHHRDEEFFDLRGQWSRAVFDEDGTVKLLSTDDMWSKDMMQGQLMMEFQLVSEGFKMRNVHISHKVLNTMVSQI